MDRNGAIQKQHHMPLDGTHSCFETAEGTRSAKLEKKRPTMTTRYCGAFRLLRCQINAQWTGTAEHRNTTTRPIIVPTLVQEQRREHEGQRLDTIPPRNRLYLYSTPPQVIRHTTTAMHDTSTSTPPPPQAIYTEQATHTIQVATESWSLGSVVPCQTTTPAHKWNPELSPGSAVLCRTRS